MISRAGRYGRLMLPRFKKRSDLPLLSVASSIVGLWACYFILVTVRSFLVDFGFQEELFVRRLVLCAFAIVVTFGLWMALRVFQNRTLLAQVFVAVLLALPAAFAIAKANQFIFADIEPLIEESMLERRGYSITSDGEGNIVIEAPIQFARGVEDPIPDGVTTARLILPDPESQNREWAVALELALGRYFLLLAWAALYLAMLAGAQARAAQAREERFRSAAKAAELRSLRYQINPHFLFNTLNSLSSLVITGKEVRAEAMIQAVSNFYRHSLAEEPTEDVALIDEIALQRDYLAIEEVRFPERLLVRIDLPAELERARVPGMILQPLVENSVRYAVARSTTPVHVMIEAFARDDRLHLVVSDDGPGLVESGGGGFGIGLSNIRDRLRARFGDRAKIFSGVEADGGYRTELIMPLEVKNGR